jgi:hypothetical protein
MGTYYNVVGPMMRRFRRARAQRIATMFPDIESMDVLDLGGSTDFWNIVGSIIRPRSVALLNLDMGAITKREATVTSGVPCTTELYDGKTIPRGDKSVDLVICNSVIEHVPPEEREAFAREIDRVARHYVVQTPAFGFWLEPHFTTPFVHWLPRSLGRKLVASPLCLAWWLYDRSPVGMFDGTWLLRRRELKVLFPQAKIVSERLLGWPKSHLAVSGAD